MEDEEALICDLAETYQIYDYKEFPVNYIAILAKGLNNDSRIKRSFAGVTVSDDYLLQSLIYDRLSLLVWFQSKDGAEGVNRPASLYESLTSAPQTNRKQEKSGFESGEEFEKRRLEILNSIKEKGGTDIG